MALCGDQGVAEFARRHWPLGAALVTVAVAWGVNTATLAENGKADAKTEQRVAQVEKDISDMKAALARIDANQANTTTSVNEIKADVKAIAEAVRERPPPPSPPR